MNSKKPYLTVIRRSIGVCLIVFSIVPFWRVLSTMSAPVAIEAVRLSDHYANLLLRGSVLVVLLAGIGALIYASDTLERPFGRIATTIVSWSSLYFAITIAVVSGILTIVLSLYVWDAKPVIPDALAQIVHSRYFANGMLAAPPGLPYEFWISTNTLLTEKGWVSQYPPGHMVFLALGMIVQAYWLIGPLLMMVAVFFTTLTAERLFPDDKIVARVGSLLFAVSPFLASLAAAFMSHVTVVALLAVAAYCAMRAKEESWQWAIPTGFFIALAFGTRSLSALVIGSVITLGPWLGDKRWRENSFSYLKSRVIGAAAGALPALVAVLGYNWFFFGSPFEFGYTAYLGPGHGLGFHLDPFGNFYGPLQALGYISSDLMALGYFLVRTPVSALLVVGLFLAFVKKLEFGERIVVTWALCLVLPLAAYWHHDLLLGPRMLSDAAPAWCLLTAVSAIGLVRCIPPNRMLLGERFSPRVFVTAGLIISVVMGLTLFLPRDVRDYATTFANAPDLPESDSPVLVFVHGSWEGRTAARLLGAGMRADSVNVALSLNSSCRMHHYSIDYATGNNNQSSETWGVSFEETDGSVPRALPSGVVIRSRIGEPESTDCMREANADSAGTIPLMPLLWQGDLPGLDVAGAMYVRDMGPTDNLRAISHFRNRRPLVLMIDVNTGGPVLRPYAEGMAILWGDSESQAMGAGSDPNILNTFSVGREGL